MARKTFNNPFIDSINIPDEFFCGRKEETKKIIRIITSGSNLVLKAPRRIGKSSLIKHVLSRQEISKTFNTIYVDVLGTTTPAEFVQEFQRAFAGSKFTLSARIKKNLKERLNSGIEITPGQPIPEGLNLPGLSMFAAPHTVEFSLKEIFDFLENTDKRNVVVFDEFQQIEKYNTKITARLRSFVQEATNTSFIFSGSSRHLLDTMFEKENEPFYNSARSMDLDIIPLDDYREYCLSMFASSGLVIEKEAINLVYNLFCGNTKDMQEIMRTAFASAEDNDNGISAETIKETIIELTESRDQQYRDLLDRLTKKKERNLLFCIAHQGLATNLTGRDTMKRYELDNASSVQNALANLTGDMYNLVYRIGKNHYRVIDKYFELWFALRTGNIGLKFEECHRLFDTELQILKDDSKLKLPKYIFEA